jgi:hypothetical protein
MRIMAGRRCGLAGSPDPERLGPVETGTLDGLTLDRVERLVQQVGFFELASQFSQESDLPRRGPKRHWLLITDGPHKHKVRWRDDSSGPRELNGSSTCWSKARCGWRAGVGAE